VVGVVVPTRRLPERARLFVDTKISPALAPALLDLARERPADPVTFLAEALLRHQPPPEIMGCCASHARVDVSPEVRRPSAPDTRLRAAATAAAASRRAVTGLKQTAEPSGPPGRPVLQDQQSQRSFAKLAEVDVQTLRTQFDKADTKKDGHLEKEELLLLLEKLVGKEIRTAVDAHGTPVIDSMLHALDEDGSGTVDVDELLAAWRAWFSAALRPVRCLVIIDMQNDFISGTLSLKACPAGQDGAVCVPVINQMRAEHPWDHVAVSLDWHPHEHCSFAECYADGKLAFPLHSSQSAPTSSPPPFSTLTLLSPDGTSPMEQILWPRHCVQNEWGSECHPDLVQRPDDVIVYKGTDPHIDSYSAFYDNQKLRATALLGELRKRNCTHLFVTGLALDVCVAFTALHAAEEGFVVTVVLDACAGVSDEGIAQKLAAFAKAGIHVARSSELKDIFDKSSIDEMTHAALRVRQAKTLVTEVEKQSGHGAPR